MLRSDVSRNIHDQDIFIVYLFYDTPSAYVGRLEFLIMVLLQIEASPCLLTCSMQQIPS